MYRVLAATPASHCLTAPAVNSGPRMWPGTPRDTISSASVSITSEDRKLLRTQIARRELGARFRFYNNQMPHQAQGYRTPAEVFHGAANVPAKASKKEEGPPEQVLISSLGAAGLSLNSTSIRSCQPGPLHLAADNFGVNQISTDHRRRNQVSIKPVARVNRDTGYP